MEKGFPKSVWDDLLSNIPSDLHRGQRAWLITRPDGTWIFMTFPAWFRFQTHVFCQIYCLLGYKWRQIYILKYSPHNEIISLERFYNGGKTYCGATTSFFQLEISSSIRTFTFYICGKWNAIIHEYKFRFTSYLCSIL